MQRLEKIEVVDTHTGGEPTRVVISGGPDLGVGSPADLRERFARNADVYRSAIVNEPRGSDVMVGALLLPPVSKTCVAGVIFFNNVGYLGMCGHGTMGVAAALGFLGRIGAGAHWLETPAGVVKFTYDGRSQVSVENVPAFRHAREVQLDVPDVGYVAGDVAWGGNWFFLVHGHHQQIALKNVERLTDVAWRIRQALAANGVTGRDGAELDHIELFGPPGNARCNSMNFVLCPGNAYDRSPCGTGTSAKLACLYAEGALAEGQIWRQESIVGSIFEGCVNVVDGQVIPTISGQAFVNGQAALLLDADDPFRMGIRV